MQDGVNKLEFLLIALGELADFLLESRSQVKALEICFNFIVWMRDAPKVGKVLQCLKNGNLLIQAAFFREISNLIWRRSLITSLKKDRTIIRYNNIHEHADSCGLPCPIGAQKTINPTRFYRHVKISDRIDGIVRFRDSLDFDHKVAFMP